jgi:hypothetical protein
METDVTNYECKIGGSSRRLRQALCDRHNEKEMNKVKFLNIMKDDKDLIVSFALEDSELGVRSLTLLRTLFYEELLDEDERGVHVSLEGVEVEDENKNILRQITINESEIEITSAFEKYKIDISQITPSEIDEMLSLLRKQNHDNRFIIHVA